MDKSLILNNIKKYKKFSSDAEFARFLGIPAQNLSKWKARNTYDIELLYTKCTELNPEWLLTGEGNMLRNEHITENKDTNIDNISNTKDEISLLRKENESLKREVALLNENRELLTYKLQNLEKEINKINEENSAIKSKPQNRAAG